jgi:competence ComEA-like helix-hairpin-helix protein
MRLLALWLMLAFSALAAESTPPQRIDLNNGSRQEIEKLPGIGPVLTANIIAGRPYRTIDELDRVKGIGPKLLQKIRPYVFIGPMRNQAALAPRSSPEKPRININVATQKDLESLPGIGPKRAEAIIKARPFKTPDDLLKISGIKRAQMEELRPLITVR